MCVCALIYYCEQGIRIERRRAKEKKKLSLGLFFHPLSHSATNSNVRRNFIFCLARSLSSFSAFSSWPPLEYILYNISSSSSSGIEKEVAANSSGRHILLTRYTFLSFSHRTGGGRGGGARGVVGGIIKKNWNCGLQYITYYAPTIHFSLSLAILFMSPRFRNKLNFVLSFSPPLVHPFPSPRH